MVVMATEMEMEMVHRLVQSMGVMAMEMEMEMEVVVEEEENGLVWVVDYSNKVAVEMVTVVVEDYGHKVVVEMEKALVEDYGNKVVVEMEMEKAVVEIRNDMLEEEKGLVVVVDDGNNLAGEVEICNNVEEVVMVMEVEVIYNSVGFNGVL